VRKAPTLWKDGSSLLTQPRGCGYCHRSSKTHLKYPRRELVLESELLHITLIYYLPHIDGSQPNSRSPPHTRIKHPHALSLRRPHPPHLRTPRLTHLQPYNPHYFTSPRTPLLPTFNNSQPLTHNPFLVTAFPAYFQWEHPYFSATPLRRKP
jgi:hypothetical protein